MLKTNRKTIALIALTTGMMAGSLMSCIDSNYNLDNLDKTVRVNVNDLVLPINLDPITLSYMIDLDEDSEVKDLGDMYAVKVEGSFDSKAIDVDPVTVTPQKVNPVHASLLAPPNIIGLTELPYAIQDPVTSSFDYYYSGVSSSIVSMNKIGVDWTIKLQVEAKDSEGAISSIRLEGFEILLPKGLTGKPRFAADDVAHITSVPTLEYNPATGIINVDNVELDRPHFTIEMPVTAINPTQTGVDYDYGKHEITYVDKAGALKGTVVLTNLEPVTNPADFKINHVDLYVQPVLSDINIKTFSGDFKYELDNFDMDPVDLSNLPDLLTQPETNVLLANPQIYLSVTNPFPAKYGIAAETGMEIIPMRDSGASPAISPDKTASNPQGLLTIGQNGPSGFYNMILAPDPEAAIKAGKVPGYADAHKVQFTGLSRMLAGEGLPTSLNIDMVNPRIPVTHVEDYVLGPLAPVSGSYTFFAPLQFLNGTQVKYTEDKTDWDIDVLEDLTIKTLKINANITSDLPLDIIVTAWPLDKHGNKIDAEITGVNIPANAKDHPLEIALTGTITDMDGIHFEATAAANDDNQPLSPAATIKLDNLKFTVGGWYETNLDD